MYAPDTELGADQITYTDDIITSGILLVVLHEILLGILMTEQEKRSL